MLDIGSGVGRLVLATALLTPARAVGVEVVVSRHRNAVAALARAEASGALSQKQASRVHLILADATAGLPDATHVYLSNLCFPPALERRLAEALVALPSLRCAVTLRPLPPETVIAARACAGPLNGTNGGGLQLVGPVTLGMTWTPAFSALMYCCAGAVRSIGRGVGSQTPAVGGRAST
jgi:SAM-dependent methyltransferase